MAEEYQVLVVEDTEEIARLVQYVLNQLGLTNFHCSNGYRAVEFLEEHHPQLVVLDIGIPGINGWQVLETMRKDPRLDDVRVIVATAFSDAANRTVGKLQEVDGYITKPYGPRELKELIMRLMQLDG